MKLKMEKETKKETKKSELIVHRPNILWVRLPMFHRKL